MFSPGRLQLLPSSIKLIMLGVLFFSFMIFALILVGVWSKICFGVDTYTDPSIFEDVSSPQNMLISKVAQLFLSVFSFIFTALVAAWMFDTRPMHFLRLQKFPSALVLLVSALLILCSTPWINFTAYLNGRMELPASLHFLEQIMRNAEDKANVLTEAYLKMSSLSDLFLNLILIAFIPAVGEELLFRGVIQQTLNKMFSRKIFSILLTAFLFSAIHFQFYGFIPRFLLGIILGLMVEWSGSLWLSMAAHFVNNGAAVLFSFIINKKDEAINQDTIGTQPHQWWVTMISVFITVGALYYIFAFSNRNRNTDPVITYHRSDSDVI